MGMQYAPQNTINQFSAQMGITGLNNMAASNRLSMELASREGMERSRLKEQMRATNLNYSIQDRNATTAEGTLGMQLEGQRFGQMKDVATFNQTERRDQAATTYNNRMAGVSEKDAETKRIVANEPSAVRAYNEKESDLTADADWTMWGQEADLVTGLFDSKIKELTEIANQPVTMANIADVRKAKAELEKQKMMKTNFGGRVTWARDQYKTGGRRFLTSFLKSQLGNVRSLREMAGFGAQPQTQPAGTPRW
jgi:hypothetical protein